jgi:hypothetical protein
MKVFEKTWDFIYGVLLIGGAPLCTLCGLGWLSVVASNRIARGSSRSSGDAWATTFIAFSMCAAVVAFGMAVWWRVRRRILPVWVVVVEVLLGVVAAVFVWALAALLSYPG